MTRQNNPTPPECVVNGAEYYDGWVWAIYLFIYVVLTSSLCMQLNALEKVIQLKFLGWKPRSQFSVGVKIMHTWNYCMKFELVH